MTSPVLTVTAARKSFGSTTALDGASFDLRAGEWLALLGPNGAGKSTMIRAVSGRVRLDSGEITLLGNRLSGDPVRDLGFRREVGVVPQEIALYPLLTARENLEVWGSLLGLEPRLLRERVAWALDFTGLAARAGDRAKAFSGGMKRRLNIACSVLHRPRVILLDEPTAGVDPQSRERIWTMLRELRADGATLLLTSHQLDEVQQLCERIVIIDHGRVIAGGTLAELIERTVGTGRRILVRTDRRPGGIFGAGIEIGDRSLTVRVKDLGRELPRVLSAISDSGCAVEDIEIEAPSLHAVFIRLTGRELRE